MINNLIAKRYSKALFQLTKEKHEQEKMLDLLKQFKIVMKENASIYSFFNSHHIPLDQKENVLKKVFGEENTIFIAFFKTLLINRRFNYFSQIVYYYQKTVNESLGVLEGTLKLASAVDEDVKSSLKSKFETIFHKKLLLKEEIDPDLLGGGVLIVGDQMRDFSIRGKLEKLKSYLTKN